MTGRSANVILSPWTKIPPPRDAKFLPMGLGAGVAIGVAIGAATDNMALWIPIGIATGTVIGVAVARINRPKSDD